MILLTRKAEFSSAHFYWSDDLSPEENHRIFGKCANRNGHGHNYTLEVTISGKIDPITGFVVDLKQLKDILEKEVVSVYDHRHLNLEVPDFATLIPTTENIAIAIWRRLEGKIPNASLHRVRLYETPDLFADFYGDFGSAPDSHRLSSRSEAEGSAVQTPFEPIRWHRMIAHLNRRYHFSASHRLHTESLSPAQNQETYGKCNNPHGHGHNYAVTVTFSGPVSPLTGMVANLADLDAFAHQHLFAPFDRVNLNTLPAFTSLVSTTENLAVELHRIFAAFPHARLENIHVEETSNNSFDYATPT